MNKEQFIETYCKNCGTQRCEGIDSAWFEGCQNKWNLDGMNPAAEIKRLNKLIVKLSSQIAKLTSSWRVESDDSIRCPVCCFNRASIKIPLNYCPFCGTKMAGNKELTNEEC